jgi:DNA-directed RNA polymerase subunit RPC12/RpoP
MKVEKGEKVVPDHGYKCDNCKKELPNGYAEQPIVLNRRVRCPVDGCYSDEEERHYCSLECFAVDARGLLRAVGADDFGDQTFYMTVTGEGISIVTELSEALLAVAEKNKPAG